MNARVLLGAELSTHCEGGHAVGVKIQGCVFENCSFKYRYGQYGRGCISIKSQVFDNAVNRGIAIKDNEFIGSDRAVEICNAEDVILRNNLYRSIREKIVLYKRSVHNIKII